MRQFLSSEVNKEDFMTVLMESKIEATHRLQREGHWNAASIYRDRVRNRLRSEGMTRAQAREGAWEAMSERFQPVDVTAFKAALAMRLCPPGYPSATTTAWQAVWAPIALVAEFDQPLRKALGIDGRTEAEVLTLYRMLPVKVQQEIETRAIFESDQLADDMMRPRPERLLEWARPQLSKMLETVDREALDTDYECMTFEFLERLVDAWPLLEESVELFWEHDEGIAS